MQLNGKKILLGVTASIAAYKAVELCRLLVKEGADVRVIMTPSTIDFITPLTFSVISKNPVLIDLVSEKQTWNNHVELALWADLLIIAPATANSIAKFSFGLCDNLLSAVFLSARCPVMIAPAMDHDMYGHNTMQINLDTLKDRGNTIIGPAKGELASGLTGDGRMEEPPTILESVKRFFLTGRELAGKKVLVTAGPTREAIDPVRYISNQSSGKMGFAIAEEFKSRGADVTLIAGPNNLKISNGIKIIPVISALDMHLACMEEFRKSDIAIMAAAVADFTPDNVAEQKIKKSNSTAVITLKPTTDILAEMGSQKKKGQLLVGFALETNDALNNAKDKLRIKNLDLIVLNSLADEGAGFNYDTNKITMIAADGESIEYDLKSKQAVAQDIVNKIITLQYV